MGIKDIKRKRQEGFTIIEVMIVLVIASIILLIVFLAVPALQRNSRNTQRKNDVANLLAAVNEYASNNNGKLPTDLNDFKDNAKLGFYDIDSEVNWATAPPLTGQAISNGNTEVWMNPYSSCNDNNVESATSRQFTALWNVEDSSGINQEQCQEG